MATSKHFLKQVQTGDVAAALQAALENAGSLQIVTHIAGAGAANDLPDSQKIYTCIDAVAGTIETAVGEQFVQDGNFKVLCEGHMQQVVAGCSSVRDNLDTIQALLDWLSDDPGMGSAPAGQGGNAADSYEATDEVATDTAQVGEAADDASEVVAAAALGAAAVGAAAVSGASAEGDMLELMEQPADSAAEASDAGEGDLLDGLSMEDDAPVGELNLDAALNPGNDDALVTDNALVDENALEVGSDLTAENGLDGSDVLAGDLGLGDQLGLSDEADLGDGGLGLDLDTTSTESQSDGDLGFELDDLSTEAEDAGPETEFLTADTEDNTQLFGSETEAVELASEAAPGGESLGTDLGDVDLGGDLGDVDLDANGDLGEIDLGGAELNAAEADISLGDVSSDDPLAGLELGSELGGENSSDDPFNLESVNLASPDSSRNDLDANGLENGSLGMDAQPNLEEDTLAGVSWAESGPSDSDLDLGGLDLGSEASPSDEVADPEVDDLALDAIGDFDSGMWDEASAETAGVAADESPAKVTRSLESLFSADDGNAPSAEGESGSGDPLSALFSDTSLEDIPSDSAAGGDGQETLAANPFEIDDLENDPFADLMLDEPNS